MKLSVLNTIVYVLGIQWSPSEKQTQSMVCYKWDMIKLDIFIATRTIFITNNIYLTLAILISSNQPLLSGVAHRISPLTIRLPLNTKRVADLCWSAVCNAGLPSNNIIVMSRVCVIIVIHVCINCDPHLGLNTNLITFSCHLMLICH